MKINKNTALFIGITAGFAFLTGLLWGLNKGADVIVPCVFFVSFITPAIALLLFTVPKLSGADV